MVSEEEGFLDIYEEVSGMVTARGNLVPDAHLAALLKQHGVAVLYSMDNDFRRFPFLSVKNPFATPR